MRYLAVVLAAGALLTGCDPGFEASVSLQPTFEEGDVRFEPALLGEWGGTDSDGETWVFSQHGESGYRLKYSEDDYDVHFFEVAGTAFLDVCSHDPKFFDIPGHLPVRATLEGDTLRLDMFRYAWMRERVVEQTLLPHYLLRSSPRRGLIVLTAPPSEIRYFLLRFAQEPEAFEELVELRRVGR